ncbi:DUF4149 domain-containing protein [Cognatazoarcus halotolerans]|uniref:DUF4149 domain-containing protein n=1 Tax=Cognatazoarcus halotolerans TaxID=2686016 RepID=UPI001357F144|nr:DUF4149 domain-containing protein [Cognatazoarcus halotolerans]MBX3680589.1 DUF4149 domain-containing protein [Rhodocyclaceae bacterium]MCB1898822.1 DUF4149 domain-containing protein [Rhodocyclaceae bacterium]MCP5309550.1 DUF4149 domain-containing protein [Zoogloeaceae bacterium]
MSRFLSGLYSVAIVMWVGAMWTVGYMVAPVLFATLSDRGLAGILAGKLFGLVAMLGIAVAVFLIASLLFRRGLQVFRDRVFWVVLAMLLMTLVGHFGIQPVMAQLKADALPREVMQSVLRDRFATWHGISSVLYLIQSVLGLALILLHGRGPRP